MQTLKVLEDKLAVLVELVKDLKTENAKLAEENALIAAKLSMLESSLQDDALQLDELKQEKELTLLVIDDLIKNIDSLVGNQG
jgi:regulator of replication initiation timing